MEKARAQTVKTTSLRWGRPVLLIAAASLLVGLAPLQSPVRKQGESALLFAERALGRTKQADDLRLVESVWNGRRTLFADFLVGEDRALFALQQEGGASYRTLHVTTGEHDGGSAHVAAIGFANADRDPARELIVILAWPVIHYDVHGTDYAVRILDDPKPGERRLRTLDSLSRRFETEACDCDWRDGNSKRFRLKTIAAVKRALRQAGY